jgi:spermidine synthase
MTGASLRRRDDGAVELRVDGVFVMDDVETTSERLLAHVALDAGAREIVVGGLGLGFTARELLADPAVERVVVAELHAEIADWMRGGTIPGADVLADPRLELVIGDVRDVVAAQPDDTLDAIVLDVDNGPDFLVHPGNAEVYGTEFIAACARRLRPAGRLCIWSMADSPPLRSVLAEHFDEIAALPVDVRLQDRDEHYWILTASRHGGVGAEA